MLAGLVAVAGCSFESSDGEPTEPGLGENSAGTTDASDETSEGTTAASGTASSDPTAASDPTATSDPTAEPEPTPGTSETDSTTATTLGPSIVIVGDDFGDLEYQTAATRDFLITNVGDDTATTFEVSTSGPFDLETTDCPATLGPGESCNVRLDHASDVLGPFTGALEAVHDAGMADAPLSADVRGRTGNLVTDGGFERCPEGPWQSFGEGEWICNDSFLVPHGGTGCLAADTGPNNEPFEYRLDIDLSPFANAIETGAMRFEFRGWARTLYVNDDDYRIRVRYLGGETSSFDTGLLTVDTWTEHMDDRIVPDATAEARIQLYCEKTGGFYCDAFFDDIVLVGIYNGS